MTFMNGIVAVDQKFRRLTMEERGHGVCEGVDYFMYASSLGKTC